jgi:RNA polymerase sigma-70 factor (ECF subfamily)
MLRHLLDDAADAEDVLQRSYIRALESLGTLRDQERLIPWFDRVIRNAAWDWIRRCRAEARALAVLSQELPETTPVPAGADSACRCATRLLGVLPARHADVLRRVYLNEIPIEVVARRLRTTPNNVRVRLHRARAALREQLIAKCEGCKDRHFTACMCSGPHERDTEAG